MPLNTPINSIWTRRRTVIGGQVCPDDWTVRLDGRDVGRVLLGYGSRGGREWIWASWGRTPENGRVETLEEALECVRRSVMRGS